MRCFTFQDFQLVPTIEEYEQIMDIPLSRGVPYKHLEQHACISTLSSITKIPQDTLKSRLVDIKSTKAISQRFLEAYLFQLSTERDWEIFMNVLALTLYRVMLFRYAGDYIDYAAMDIFVAVRTRSENPVPKFFSMIF